MNGRPSRPNRDHRPRIDNSTWLAAAALGLLLTLGFVLYKSDANRATSVIASQETLVPGSSASR
jgi:hypothetical protein